MTVSFRNKVIKNTPKVALDSIKSLIVGGYKAGKTRLWKEISETHYANPEETLLLSFERGYETWELENVLPICEEGDEAQQWEYFRRVVVKGLIQEAKEGRVVKLIGWDTVDRAIDAASAWVLKDTNDRLGTKFESLQDISEKTNENGWTLLYNELKRQVDALDNAKYGQMFLAWTKEKETTLYNGLKYNSVELMMNNTAKKVFESQASLICCLFNEVKVLDKTGNEIENNAKDKKGRDKASNFHETKVVMVFRPNEYVSIAGGRYTNLPEDPVDYSIDNFLHVFEEAVKGQLKKTDKTIEELTQEQEIEKEEHMKQEVEKDNLPIPKTVPELHKELKSILAPVMKDEKNKAATITKFKEIFNSNEANYLKIEDVELLEKALQYVKDTFNKE